MVSKHKFLGVAATKIAATSAKVAKAAKFTAFVAAVCFVGCDSAPSIEAPLASIEPNNRGDLYLRIQSQDNGTVIEDIIINRGNCLIAKYRLNSATSEVGKAYKKAHPDRTTTRLGRLVSYEIINKFSTKSGEIIVVEHNGFGIHSGKTGKLKRGEWSFEGMEFYNALDDESKALFEAVFPIKLPYGEKTGISHFCSGDEIIEVEVVANGGSFTYKFK